MTNEQRITELRQRAFEARDRLIASRLRGEFDAALADAYDDAKGAWQRAATTPARRGQR